MLAKVNWISLLKFHRFSLERQAWDRLLLQYQNEVPPEEMPRLDLGTGKEPLSFYLVEFDLSFFQIHLYKLSVESVLILQSI